MKPEEKEARKKYLIVAEHYHNFRTKLNPQGWLYNEHLEMPATFELLGNLKGKKVLDIGCGAGIYARKMTKKGAKVKGFDLSPEMLSIAKRENPKLDLRKGSFYKIPFKEKFDIVFASLAFNYISDWDKGLKEIKRVLKKGGYFIFSQPNPFYEICKKREINGKEVRVIGDYFKEGKIRGIYEKIGDNEVQLWNYHRTYETIIKTIIRNGFEIIDYKDCFPLKKSKKLFPKEYAFTSKMPYFCVWKVRKRV